MDNWMFEAEQKWTNLVSSIQHKQILQFFQSHLQAFETEKLASSFVFSLESFIMIIAYLFFFAALCIVGWQAHRYIQFIKNMASAKKFRFSFLLQSFFTAAPLLIAGLAAGINGYDGIFWVFSFLGFCLLLIFSIDRALKPGIAKSK